MNGQALWIGATDDEELGLARTWIRTTLERCRTALHDFSSPLEAARLAAAAPATPTLALLASDHPARWTLDDVVTLSRAWPLMPIVSVAASLVDGRRRSGPPLPGIEEVVWHDLPGRLETWLHAWATRRPGTLTSPSTTRRDERLLGIVPAEVTRPMAVAVVAPTPLDGEGLAALAETAGGSVVSSRCGRPLLDESADVVLWDVGRLTSATIGWLGILAANRPHLEIVLIESFPRGDSVRAALDAGASAVLGKPLSIEGLTGTFRRLLPPADGLEATAPGR